MARAFLFQLTGQLLLLFFKFFYLGLFKFQLEKNTTTLIRARKQRDCEFGIRCSDGAKSYLIHKSAMEVLVLRAGASGEHSLDVLQ